MREFRIAPYTLLDSSPEGIRLAGERFAPEFGSRIEYLHADVFSASVSRRYDLVFSVGLIEHFTDAEIVELVRLHRRFATPDELLIDGSDSDGELSGDPIHRGALRDLALSGRTRDSA